MSRGYAHLVAVMDWSVMDRASHKTLSFRLSNTLDAFLCSEALKEAVERYGCP